MSILAADLAAINSIETIAFLATTDASTVALTDAVYTANGASTITVTAAAATTGKVTVNASALTSANSVIVDLSGAGGLGAGAHVVTGGAGNDTLILDASDLTATFAASAGGSGTDTIQLTGIAGGGSLSTNLTGWEQVTFASTAVAYTVTTTEGNVASGATFTISGATQTAGFGFVGSAESDGGKFSVLGGTGADTIVGGSGADTIDGGSGTDSITGGAGSDSITGGAGLDTVVAGLGADTITLGTGSDTDADIVKFVMTGTVTATSTVTDFDAATGSTSEDIVSVTKSTAGANAWAVGTTALQSTAVGVADARLVILDSQTYATAGDAAAAADNLQHDTVQGQYLFVWTDSSSVVHVSWAIQDADTELSVDQYVDLVKLTGVTIANINSGDFVFG